MQITCAKENLINSINIVSKAVSTRTTLPILECILLNAEEAGLKMLANDLEVGIETTYIPAEINETGSVALEAKMFFEIIRRLPDSAVSIVTDEKNVTTIKCEKTEFKILGQSGEEFPYLPLVEKTSEYKILSNDLRNMIRQTIFSVSVDESKPVLTGELLEIENGSFHIVAVDGFRVSYRRSDIHTENEDISVVVPSKTLNEISKILPNDDEQEISMFFTEKHVLFEMPNCTVVSRLLEGEFLKYKQIFTEDYTTIFNTDKSGLLLSLERASLISKETKKTPVKLKIENDLLIITSNTEMGTSYDELSIDMDGSPLEIAFNPRYLIDALKAIDEDRISIQFTTSLSPCIIKGTEPETYKYLILPLRLNS